ncbi:hypothetical protein [Metallosphaera hakonensis]|uniref:Uncharacterized protein n=1 Tax=Metallosphaera hakonensis JCM 8857 = DSM 7519 TaxID=1293036 RepID=A0A2U9IVY2_9CREN|nr:hypothetical protein [Metallosphaera hakonensis]AWS00134.1 hypothetical protein DFR87_11055 [Metallosphaera hakonensis JCM 8857 = DSM 7519]
MRKSRRGISDSITVMILIVVAVTLTLSVAVIGFTLFKSYGSQNLVVVKGVPVIYQANNKLVLNITLQNMGTTTILIRGVSLDSNVENSTAFTLPAGETETFQVEFSPSTFIMNETLVKVTVFTSSQLIPQIYTYAQVKN